MTSQPPASGGAPDDPTVVVPAADDTAVHDTVPVEGAEPAADGEVMTDADAAAGVPPWRRRAGQVWHYARWPVFAGAAVVALLFAAVAWIWFTTDLPTAAAATDSAILLDRNGDELAVLAQDGLRIEIDLDEMGPVVPDAVVAAEDRRFYEHDGVDPGSVFRAFWNNVRNDEIQGGSTITQQLVKNVYLDSERTFSRKFREAILAMKVEQQSSKDEILERYLNTVYFGRGAYGIEAAARTYFDKPAGELQPAQAAMLVGILRSPETLDPAEEPEAVERRRNEVLDTMVELGTLPAAKAEEAKAAPIEVLGEVAPTKLSAGVAPHFVEQVRRDIVDEFGERALYDRGLVIHTTLDVTDQKAAEESVAKNLDDPADPQAAVVGIDRAGAVRAWVGGRDFEALKLDLVSSDAGTGRQPGSTFKPLVLAAGFEAGMGAGQQYPAPASITLDVPPEPWEVSNAGGSDYGVLSLFDATVQSVNTVYAQHVLQVGPEAVVDVADRLGVGRELEAERTIALGAEEVTPLELATVFSTLSRSGERIDPYLVTKIETRGGETLFELDEPEKEEAVEPRIADTVSHILSETPRRGTARRAALDRPMAAKTGTTQDNADAWLAGYTPEYTAVVWMGYADSNKPMEAVDGQAVQGGTIPAQIWHDFMVKALEDVEPTEFPPPDEELLGDPNEDMRLTASPPRVEPGERVVVDGSGFEVCINGWQAVLEGASTRYESPSDGGSDKPNRTAAIVLPPDAPEGEYRVRALCDFGAGPRPLGPTASVLVGPDPDSTTTTSSTTSTTKPNEKKDEEEDKPGNGNTTTTSTTTTTTTSTTTTTTAPEEEE
jgi:penicillin-binding protein 1A